MVDFYKIRDYGVFSHNGASVLPLPQDLGNTVEKVAKICQEPEVFKGCCKIMSSGHGRAFALMNPQQHGSLHKVKPVNIPKWVEKRLLMPHPFRATSDCPQLLTMIYLMLEEGCDFCQLQIV